MAVMLLPQACLFLAEQRAAGRATLVHCEEGISRGPTAVAAYLMWADKLDLAAALRLIRRMRSVVMPKAVLRMDLQRWEFQQLGVQRTMSIDCL